MALSQVQHVANSNTGTGTSVAATLTSTGSGNLIVVALIGTNTQAPTSVTDNQSNTYTKITGTAVTSAGGRTSEIWYCAGATGGVTTVTATYSPSASARRSIFVSEVSGAATSSVVDSSNSKSDSGGANPLSGASDTTIAANTYICTTVRTSNTALSVASPFTLNDTNPAGGTAFQIVSSASTYTPSWTFDVSPSDDCYSSAAFVQASGGGGGGPTNYHLLTVCGVGS